MPMRRSAPQNLHTPVISLSQRNRTFRLKNYPKGRRFFDEKTIMALSIVAALLAGSAFAAQQKNSTGKIPTLDHAFVIMMENHSYGEIIGNSNAPFINALAQSTNLATNYFAVGHPSLPNYLEFVGGSNFGITSDNFPNWHNGPFDPSLVTPLTGTGTDAATPAASAPFGTAIPPAPYTAATIAAATARTGQRIVRN